MVTECIWVMLRGPWLSSQYNIWKRMLIRKGACGIEQYRYMLISNSMSTSIRYVFVFLTM